MDLGTISAQLRFGTKQLTADLAKAKIQIRQAQTDITTAAKSISKAGDGMIGIGKKLTMGLTLPIVALTGVSTKFGLDFSKSIGYANTMLKLSGPQLETFKKGVLAISNQWGKSADDIGRSAYTVSSVLHTSAKDTISILKQTTKAAKAGKITTEDATNAVIRTMSIYDIKAKDTAGLIDSLSATVKAGNANWGDLAQVLPQAAGAGKTLGVSLQTLEAAFAAMSSKSGSSAEAGTYLRAVLLSLVKPSDAMKKAIKDMGYESAQAAIKQIGLSGVLEELRKKYGSSAEALGELIPNVRGISGASALFAAKGKDFAEALDMIKKSSGETDAQIKAGESTYEKFTESINRLKNMAIELFASFEPYLIKALALLTKFAKKFESLSPQVKHTIVIIGALLAIIGPLLVVAGTLFNAVGQIKLAFVALNAILPITGTLSSAALGPIGLVIMGIVAAVAILVLAWKKDWGGIREKTKAFLLFFKGFGKTVGEKIALIKDKMIELKNKAKDAFESASKKAVSFASKMSNVVKTIREKIPLIDAYFKIWEKGFELIKIGVYKLLGWVKQALDKVGIHIKNFFDGMENKGMSWNEKQKQRWSDYDSYAQKAYGVVGKATDIYYTTFENTSKRATDTAVENEKKFSNSVLYIKQRTADISGVITSKQIDDELSKLDAERQQKERQAQLDAEKAKYLAAQTAEEKAAIQKEVDRLLSDWEYQDEVAALQKKKALINQKTQAELDAQKKIEEAARQAEQIKLYYEQEAERQVEEYERKKADMRKSVESDLVDYLRNLHQKEENDAIKAIEGKRDADLSAIQDEMDADYEAYTQAIELINKERDAKLGVINKEIADLQAKHEKEQRAEWLAEERKRLREAKTAEERKAIQKEIDKRLAEWKYQDTIDGLRKQAEKVREEAKKEADAKKKEYEEEKANSEQRLEETKKFYDDKLEATKKFYDDLELQRNLDAEAEKILANNTMTEILKMLEGTKGKWAKLGAEIGDTFWNNLLNSINNVEGLAKLIGDIPSFGGGGGLGGVTHLANGGNVYRPTLAIIGENATPSNPEVVLPPGKGIMPSVNVVYNLYGVENGESLERQLAEHDRKLLRMIRGGRW